MRRCKECGRCDDDGRNVRRREYDDVIRSDGSPVSWFPRRYDFGTLICETCWDRMRRGEPTTEPAPRVDYHEPVHRGERCLNCGEPGLLPIEKQGTRREGVVVYECPECGQKMDTWELEDFRWHPTHAAEHEGDSCPVCAEGRLEAGPVVEANSTTVVNGENALYRCSRCDAMVSDEFLVRCLFCGRPGVVHEEIERLAQHVTLHECPDCGTQMDTWELEDYVWDPDAGKAVEAA